MSNIQEVHIIVGLGYGDEGKGKIVDYLCGNVGNIMVVRFSGGQQCGHTVVKENGVFHTHASFGSGTLNGSPSYFTEHCTFYPPAVVIEHKVLLQKGVTPQLYLHPLAKLTTPYDVAYNKDLSTGNNTCGMGVGQTMKRHSLPEPYGLYAADLFHPLMLREKMKRIEKYYSTRRELIKWSDVSEDTMEDFYDDITRMQEFTVVAPYDILTNKKALIFEGSQGIGLDMDHGIFPDVTYANTTSKNAIEVCRKIGTYPQYINYVTRCYQTRHGRGWMTNENDITLINNEKETNVNNPYQGPFRTGSLDKDLVRQSIIADHGYHGTAIQATLFVNHLDQLPSFDPLETFKDFKSVYLYTSDSPLTSSVKYKTVL